MSRLLLLGLCLAVAAALPAIGGESEPEPPIHEREPRFAVPDDQSLEASGAVIGDIIIRAGNVFDTSDPAENNTIFRLANRLHRTTRDPVIEQQLLFRSGEPFSRRLLDESERLLRSTRYLYDAQIRPVRYRNNRVDLEVVTRDVWTLTAGLGVSRSGGENSTRFEIQDTNFLGTGRELAIERTDDVDRTRQLLSYKDRYLAGSRTQLELWLAEASDGSLRRLELERPFISLDSHWGSGLFARSEERVDPLYRAGEEVDRFRLRRDYAEIYGGLSRGLVDGWTRRLTAGYTFDRRRFDDAPDEEPAFRLPPDRTLSYPWIGFEVVEDRYLETNDIDQLQRTEDFFIGRRAHARLGWAAEAFGSDRDRLVFDSGFYAGFEPTERGLLLISGDLSTRWADSQEEDLRASLKARYYQRNFGNNLFFVSAEVDATSNADQDTQLLLGGDSGLRGYPLRYQDGDRRFLLTLEQRFYTDWHLFRLLHIGGAVFFDIGRAWFDGEPRELPGSPTIRDGVLKDIGIGLRLSSSRSGQGSMIHLDVAFPLDRDGSIRGVQWLVSTRDTF
ncbi:MAG: hypothetical protein AAF604_06790 [Acidobacteriota bacterium]